MNTHNGSGISSIPEGDIHIDHWHGKESMTHIQTAHTPVSFLQSYQTILYSRPIHPELFAIQDHKEIRFGPYQFEAWIMQGRHHCRFEISGACACELVTESNSGLPDTGIVESILCAGEREFEHRFARSDLNYMTSVQTEQLSSNLYLSTFEELDEFAREQDSLVSRWDDEIGPCASILNIQRYAKEIHVQSYHMIAREGLVLRTQSLFEHL